MRAWFLLVATLALPVLSSACGASATGGDSGNGGDAAVGSDGDAGHDGGSVRRYTDAQLLRACALSIDCHIASSTLWTGTGGVSQCVAELQLLNAATGLANYLDVRLMACATSASDCTAFADCVSLGHGADYCAASPGYSCDGNVLVQCSAPIANNGAFAQDCAALGSQCDPQGYCDDGTTCDPSQPPTCQGNSVVYCNRGSRRTVIDCNLYVPGTTCVPPTGTPANASPLAYCVPNTPACDLAAPASCNGNVAQECSDRNRHLILLDCAAYGAVCDATGASSETRVTQLCKPPGAACQIEFSPDMCSGTSLRVCLNGQYQSVDCASIGKRTCSTDPQLGSRCVP